MLSPWPLRAASVIFRKNFIYYSTELFVTSLIDSSVNKWNCPAWPDPKKFEHCNNKHDGRDDETRSYFFSFCRRLKKQRDSRHSERKQGHGKMRNYMFSFSFSLLCLCWCGDIRHFLFLFWKLHTPGNLLLCLFVEIFSKKYKCIS